MVLPQMARAGAGADSIWSYMAGLDGRPARDYKGSMSAPPESESAAPSARMVAAFLLGAVLDRRRALDDAMTDPQGGFAALADRDRAFTRRLVATALRRRGQVDAVLQGWLTQWPKGLPGNALRLGATELLFLDAPAHAAVHSTVEIVPEKMRGLVNAVLRKVASEGAAIVAQQDAPRLNTPDWLWHSWVAAYGEETTRAIAEAHSREAPLDISVASDVHDWATNLKAEVLPTGSLRRHEGGPVESLPGFDSGGWWIQDAAATLPVRMLGDVKGQIVADLCAAPGGKTAQLGALGAAVTAVDRSPQRLKRLQQNLDRLRQMASVICADIETWQAPEAFDAVLLDAPCTATGTIRRHPDLPHIKSETDLAKLRALQSRLIGHAWDMVKPGGRMVYCVCSLQPEEGEGHLEQLRALPGASLHRASAADLNVPNDAVTKDGCLRTLPSMWHERGGMDGFFAVRLDRA